jgi:hypothetical protein
LITPQSTRQISSSVGDCTGGVAVTAGYFGLPQSVLVSSLGFTLPFSLK